MNTGLRDDIIAMKEKLKTVVESNDSAYVAKYELEICRELSNLYKSLNVVVENVWFKLI